MKITHLLLLDLMNQEQDWANHSSEPSSNLTQNSFEDYISSSQDDSLHNPLDNITEFTHSTSWYVRNYMNLNPRAYYGHFEKGNFNYYDSYVITNPSYVRPYLPRSLRFLILNMRVIYLSSDDQSPRCLHFPIQEDECRTLLTVFRNLNHDRKCANKFIFSMRNASFSMPGRISFDIPRILQDLAENNMRIEANDVGLFSVTPNIPAKINEKMTFLSLPIDAQFGETREVALNERITAISSNKFIQIIDTENKKCLKYPIENISHICSVPNGNFITCTKSGIIHEFIKKPNFDDSIMYQVTNVQNEVGNCKISRGGERSYAASNITNTTIYSGIEEQFYEINFKKEFIDFDVNNDDIYVATQLNNVEYYQFGEKFATWNSPGSITSINIDPMSLNVGLCTSKGCYIIDARTPSIVGIGSTDIKNPISLHFSPFQDLAVAITENGIVSFDFRQMDCILSSVKLTSVFEKSLNIKGNWIPESRLFSLSFKESFLITCPYLENPILDNYKIPYDNLISVHSNLKLNIIHQSHSITFIGGYGYPFYLPNVV